MKLIKLPMLCLLASCSMLFVSQEDLDSWKGQPVDKLNAHSFFMTVPVEKSFLQDGTEIRNYRNGGSYRSFASCNYGFCTTNTREVVCNNIFYIKDGIVSEYKVEGNCRTDDSVRPEK